MLEELGKDMKPEEMKELKAMMKNILQKIHPDIHSINYLGSSLVGIRDVSETLELSDELSEKLCTMQIDLYALIKDIVKEKEIPQAAVHALDHLLELPARDF